MKVFICSLKEPASCTFKFEGDHLNMCHGLESNKAVKTCPNRIVRTLKDDANESGEKKGVLIYD
jgi:hypothetical protein